MQPAKLSNEFTVPMVQFFAKTIGKTAECGYAGVECIGDDSYIDNFPVETLKGDKLVYGTDIHGRLFVAFGAEVQESNDKFPAAIVAFQRFEDADTWVCAELRLVGENFRDIAMKMFSRLASPTAPKEPKYCVKY